MAKKRTPHQILGIDRDATPDEIKKAYRKLIMEAHPDRNSSSAEAEEKARKLNEARDALLNVAAPPGEPTPAWALDLLSWADGLVTRAGRVRTALEQLNFGEAATEGEALKAELSEKFKQGQRVVASAKSGLSALFKFFER